LLGALNAVPNPADRERIIRNLSARAIDKLRIHTGHLLANKRKPYIVNSANSEVLRKALSKHSGTLRKFVNSEAKEQRGGWIIPFLISAIVPVLTSLFKR